MIRIKNWHKFQHFKHRRPPWIKLYKDLLDDPEWHELPGDDAKSLIMLWLVASENDGNLPDEKKLAFRLRTSISKLNQICSRLSSWLERDDINTISDRYQVDAPETETETYREETETDSSSSKSSMATDWNFEKFWVGYPRKVGKLAAQRSFLKATKRGEVSFETLMAAVGRIEASDPKFIPHPATWLNDGRYLDGQSAAPTSTELTPQELADRDFWLAKLAKESHGERTELGGPASVVEAEFGDRKDDGEMVRDKT
jgi:hypothetical protein